MHTSSWENVNKQITNEHVSKDLKLWIKQLHTEILNEITYIHVFIAELYTLKASLA